MRKLRKNKTFKRKRFYKPRAKMAKKKSGLRRLVRREVARMAENKTTEVNLASIPVYQGITTSTAVYSLIPNISQGTTQATRIGNRIRIRKATLRMSITINNLGATSAPTYVDLYIFKYKPQKGYSSGALPSTAMDNFLQSGSTSIPYTGGISDYLRPVNKDLFDVKFKKRMCMFNPQNGTTQVASTASLNPNRFFTLDITKFYKKVLEYNDNTSVPTNDALWIALGSTQCDGTIFFVTIATYNCLVNLEFEDY